MKYPVVDGREIVPVRLIPLITNAWLGQVALSGILANRVKISGWPYPSDHEQINVNVYDEDTGCNELTTITRAKPIDPHQRENGVHAYHLNGDGIPVKMWSSEWEVIYRVISVIEPQQRKKEEKNGVPDSKESAWRLKVTKILPPGVFLWRDDLDLLWKAHISSFIHTKNERPDFRKMNYDAYIRPKYRKLVWEGFEHLMPSITDEKSLLPEERKSTSSSISLDEPTPTLDLNKRSDPFNRKGVTVPIEKRRRTSSFTDVMDYLFNNCRETGKDELLEPGNIDEFMSFARTQAHDGSKEDPYVAERLAKVICKGGGYFEMQDGHGKSKPKKGEDANKYYRIKVQTKLSALRKKHSQPLD